MISLLHCGIKVAIELFGLKVDESILSTALKAMSSILLETYRTKLLHGCAAKSSFESDASVSSSLIDVYARLRRSGLSCKIF